MPRRRRELQDAGARLLQGQVLPVRLFDQPVQDGVVHDVPPLGQVGRGAGDVSILVVDPVRGDGCGGGLVVRADLEAVANPVTQGAAAGQEKTAAHEDREQEPRKLQGFRAHGGPS